MALIKTFKEFQEAVPACSLQSEYFEKLKEANSKLLNLLDKSLKEIDVNDLIWKSRKVSLTKDDLINKDNEDLVELINQIRHIEIVELVGNHLIGKSEILIECHPTQSSSKEKEESFDLVFKNCIVEVFGGVDIKNNGKLKKDIEKLLKAERCNKYLAFYKSSISHKSIFYKALTEGPHYYKFNRKVNLKLEEESIKDNEGDVFLIKLTKI